MEFIHKSLWQKRNLCFFRSKTLNGQSCYTKIPLSQCGSERKQRSVRLKWLRAAALSWSTCDTFQDTEHGTVEEPLTRLHASLKPQEVWISQPMFTLHKHPRGEMAKRLHVATGAHDATATCAHTFCFRTVLLKLKRFYKLQLFWTCNLAVTFLLTFCVVKENVSV